STQDCGLYRTITSILRDHRLLPRAAVLPLLHEVDRAALDVEAVEVPLRAGARGVVQHAPSQATSRLLVAVAQVEVVTRHPLPHRLGDPRADRVIQVDVLPVLEPLRRAEADRGH